MNNAWVAPSFHYGLFQYRNFQTRLGQSPHFPSLSSISFNTMKCQIYLIKLVQSHYSVWHQRMPAYDYIRSYTQIYVRGTLGIRRVRSSYAGIRRCTLLYAEDKIFFRTCSKNFSVCERIDNTLFIRSSYARHILDTLGIRWIR